MRRRLVLKIQDGPSERYSWETRKRAYRSESRHKKQKAWVHQRLMRKAALRLKNMNLQPEQIKFEWCGQCRTSFIRCPECNNNTCNAMSPCGRCYHYQELALKTRGNKWPEKSEFPDAERLDRESRIDWLQSQAKYLSSEDFDWMDRVLDEITLEMKQTLKDYVLAKESSNGTEILKLTQSLEKQGLVFSDEWSFA